MLRALEPYDVELLYEVENDATLWYLGATNMPFSMEFLQNYILSTTGDIFTDKQLRLIIEEDGKAVGIIDLQDFEPKHRRAEVGIVVLPAYRRKGYAFKALQELGDYARDVLQLHQLHVTVPARNVASVRLFSKSGYNYSSRLKDWVFCNNNYEDALLMQRML